MTAYDPKLLAKLNDACSSAKSNAQKGAALADLVEYVLSEVPGLSVRERSSVDPSGGAEYDFLFNNVWFDSHLPHEVGVILFVECKNEKRKISAEQVRDFSVKLRDRGKPLGLMVSSAGLAGRGRTHAHDAIIKELAQGRYIVVLLRSELAALSQPEEFVALFTERLAELVGQGQYTSI
jgi:hypothetical protein